MELVGLLPNRNSVCVKSNVVPDFNWGLILPVITKKLENTKLTLAKNISYL